MHVLRGPEVKPEPRLTEPGPENIALDDPWPPFLDLLDDQPDQAWAQCHEYLWRLFTLRPPAVLRSLSTEDREDLLADLVQGFRAMNFALLRSYENQGRPFSAWAWTVCRNKALDRLRYLRRRQHDELGESLPLKGASPVAASQHSEALGVVQSVVRAMSPQCQILLQAAAEGYSSRELQQLLGLPEGSNKLLADRLRNCRNRLKREFAKAGVEVEDLL